MLFCTEDAVVGCLLIELCIFIKWTFSGHHSPDYTQYSETLSINSVLTIFTSFQHIYTRVTV